MTELTNPQWWSDEEEGANAPIEVHHHVTAILVSKDAAAWLPRTLQSLRAQTRPVDQFVAVDVGSEDASLALLQSAGADLVESMPGVTQAEALKWADQQAKDHPGLVEWLWIVHDDSAPEPQALERLLRAANFYPHAAVIGGKVVDWEHGRHVIEVGSSITAIGTRFTGLESGERDQGQHDQLHLVHSVSSAGMLIRREVFRNLGGFSQELTHFRTELEFCWRVWESGSEVVIEPDARIRHVSATVRELRPADETGSTPHLLDRQAGSLLILSRTSPRWLWARMLLLVLAGGLRALGYTLVQDFKDAREEWRGTWRALRSLPKVKKLREASGSTPLPTGIRATTGEQISHAMTEIVDGVERGWFQTLDFLFPDRLHSDEVGIGQAFRAALKRPASMMAIVTILVGLVITRSGWGSEQLTLPNVGYVPSSAADLWNSFIGGWHSVGMGSDLASHPLVGIVALASLLTFGNPALFIVVLSALGPWLAALSLHLTLRKVLPHRPSRAWLSSIYGLSPVVLLAAANGDVGVLLAAILLPWSFVLVQSAVSKWRAAAGTGIALAVLASIWPAIWLVALVLLAIYVIRIKPSSDNVFRLSVAFVWSIGLLMPWSVQVISDPARLFTQFGVKASEIVPAWHVLLGADRASSTTPWWWGIGLVIIALFALLEERTHRLSKFAWLVIAAAMGISTVAQLVATFFGGPDTLPALSVPTLLITGALLLSLASTVMTVRVRLNRSNFGWRQISTAIAVIIISTLPVAAVATTLSIGSDISGMHRESELTGDALRGFTDDLHLRTLVLSTQEDGTYKADLLDGRAEYFGDDAVHDTRLRKSIGSDIAQWLTTVNPSDENPLRKYAIGYIAVPSGDALARKISTLGNLSRLITARSSGLMNVWRVNDVLSRAYIGKGLAPEELFLDIVPLGQDLQVTGVVTDKTDVQFLSLAERSTGTWSASLDGKKLEQKESDVLTWIIPENTGGELLIQNDAGARFGWLMLAGFTALSILVVLAPRRRNSYRDEWLEEA